MSASSAILLLLDRDPFPTKLTTDVDHASIEVDIRPGEAKRLATSEPKCERDRIERFESVALGGIQQAYRLGYRE